MWRRAALAALFQLTFFGFVVLRCGCEAEEIGSSGHTINLGLAAARRKTSLNDWLTELSDAGLELVTLGFKLAAADSRLNRNDVGSRGPEEFNTRLKIVSPNNLSQPAFVFLWQNKIDFVRN